MNTLDSDLLADKYRQRSVRTNTREILISRLAGSDQEPDLTEPTNCDGVGRVRHFRLSRNLERWVHNPLPIQPARAALGLPAAEELRAQVFQNAACNWRCWYCFVPFNLLAADEARSAWLTPDALVERYATLRNRPPMLDLTGGQPDLIPEWVPWTMEALEGRGLRDEVYLWSDDNLSADYFWRYLSDEQISRISSWRNYGRVCCFKGFDRVSFGFNTAAPEELFDRQFELFSRFVALGLDLYAYVTLTTPDPASIPREVPRFVDRLQAIDENLPLRVVPLEIQVFTPVRVRLTTSRTSAIDHQYHALATFRRELERRFSPTKLALSIEKVPLRGEARWA